MSNVWFTSDLHFGHDNMVDFRNELGVYNHKFGSTADMNERIVELWNSVVRHRDTVWVLGDLAWSKEGLKLFDRLDGAKHLILGNHDSHRLVNANFHEYFITVNGLVKKYKSIMSHCPVHPQEMDVRSWNINIHGHIHHKERCIDDPRYFNVNIDVQGRLVSLDEIQERIKSVV